MSRRLLDLEIAYAAERTKVNAGRRRLAALRAQIDALVDDLATARPLKRAAKRTLRKGGRR